MNHPGAIAVTVTVPSGIYQAIQRGVGPGYLEREFGLSDRQAQYYLQAVEEAQPHPQQIAAVIADPHFPDHAEEVLDVVVTELLTWSPDLLICLGDVLDCEALGFWPTAPSRRHFGLEMQRVKPVWEAFNARIAAIPRKILIEGNHDARIRRYLWDEAAALADLECLTLKEQLFLQDFGWEWWSNLDRKENGLSELQLGGMSFFHGHEFHPAPRPTVINPAKTYADRIRLSAVYGHVHRTGQYPNRLFDGGQAVYTVGCLQNLNVRYDPYNQWNWGFGKLTWTDTMSRFRNYRVTSWGEIQ